MKEHWEGGRVTRNENAEMKITVRIFEFVSSKAGSTKFLYSISERRTWNIRNSNTRKPFTRNLRNRNSNEWLSRVWAEIYYLVYRHIDCEETKGRNPHVFKNGFFGGLGRLSYRPTIFDSNSDKIPFLLFSTIRAKMNS